MINAIYYGGNMNTDLELQKLNDELKLRAENHRMKELERESAPFFWLAIILCLIALWGIL